MHVLKEMFTSNEYDNVSVSFCKRVHAWPNKFMVSKPQLHSRHHRAIMLVKRSSNGDDFPVSAPGLRYLCSRQGAAGGPTQCYVVLFDEIDGQRVYIAEMTAKNLLRAIGNAPVREPRSAEFSPYWFVRSDFTIVPMNNRAVAHF